MAFFVVFFGIRAVCDSLRPPAMPVMRGLPLDKYLAICDV